MQRPELTTSRRGLALIAAARGRDRRGRRRERADRRRVRGRRRARARRAGRLGGRRDRRARRRAAARRWSPRRSTSSLPVVGHVFFADTLQLALRTGYDRSVLPSLVGTQRAGAGSRSASGSPSRCGSRPSRRCGVAGAGRGRRSARCSGSTPTGRRLYDNFHETTWSPTLVCALPLACAARGRAALAVGGGRARRLARLLRPARRPPSVLRAAAASGRRSRRRCPRSPCSSQSLGLLVPRLRPARLPSESGGRRSLSLVSSSARRCARITFWSESREITVE